MSPNRSIRSSTYRFNQLWLQTIHLCSKNFLKCPQSKTGMIRSSFLNLIQGSIKWIIKGSSGISSGRSWCWACCRACRPHLYRAAINMQMESLSIVVLSLWRRGRNLSTARKMWASSQVCLTGRVKCIVIFASMNETVWIRRVSSTPRFRKSCRCWLQKE
jgi:hypothetical protein